MDGAHPLRSIMIREFIDGSPIYKISRIMDDLPGL